jgi:DNA adenine methylase
LVEPFAGGAIVSLTAGFEDLADQVVFAELDSHVSAVWKVILNGKAGWLAERIRAFELSYENVREVLNHPPKNTREHAFQALLRNRVQRSGIMASGAGLILSGENGKGLSSRWYPETLALRILEINRRKARFNFQFRDGFALIEEFADDPSAVFFVDPPYTKSAKRLYEHWAVDHERLFRLVADVAGDFLLTYDNVEEIRMLAARFNFETRTIAMKNGHNAKMTELVIGRDLSWL